MSNIQDVVMQIQDAMGALPGMKSAPDYPPESIDMFPFTVAYEGAGTWELSAGQKRWIGDVIVELHMARKDLPRDVAKAAYYSDKVPNAILKEFTSDLLGGTTEAITSIKSSGIVFMQYNTAQGAGEHLGIIYSVNIKLISSIT
jgi:hypothetical protein